MVYQVKREEPIVQMYADVMKRMLGISYDGLSKQDIEDVVMYSINKRYREEPASVYNNYKEKTTEMNLLSIANYIAERKPIITPYGVMFQQHGKSPNPFAGLFDIFMTNRDKNKAKMFSFPPGSEEYQAYSLDQILDKLDANALYGAAGAASCLFFNLHVAASITTSGRSSISAATMFFEMFLNNNVQFRGLNEVITWIDNVLTERNSRVFNDRNILDRNVTVGEAFSNIAKACTWDWTPTFEEMDVIYDILSKLDSEDLNRIYYKNNLFGFCDNSYVTKLIIKMLYKLDSPFLDPNKAPKAIKDELAEFMDLLEEYVFYNYPIIDKIDRTTNMIKKSIIVTDTDSAIVCLDGWYRFIVEKTNGLDFNIARTKMEMVAELKKNEYGDFITKVDLVKSIEPIYDYDFFTDEVTEIHKMLDMTSVVPQDGLRYSIINILSYCIGNLCNKYLVTYCKMNHSDINNPYGCKLYLKNEFLFKTILLTWVKKHYAAIQELREGHFDNKLSITGLDIDKSVLNEKVKDQMQKILFEDILNSDEFDQIKLLKSLSILEHQIHDSLSSGDREFYKPLSIKPMSHYAEPMRQQGIKASVVWNSIKGPELPGIDLTETNSIDIVKTIITPKSIESVKNDFPDVYNALKELMTDSVYKNNISSLAIPKTLEVIPDWVKYFIDYNTIINDNLSAFPFDSLGLTNNGADKNNNVNYTNIISF